MRRGIFRLERGDEWREQDYAVTDECETPASSFEEGARCCLADALEGPAMRTVLPAAEREGSFGEMAPYGAECRVLV